jgi:hypothetical protein
MRDTGGRQEGLHWTTSLWVVQASACHRIWYGQVQGLVVRFPTTAKGARACEVLGSERESGTALSKQGSPPRGKLRNSKVGVQALGG